MIRVGALLEDEDQTGALGGLLAAVLRPGDVVRLTGELGSGKTTLVRAIASGLGADPRSVSSPTFTVIHEYPGRDGLMILHADAYRMDPDDDLERARLGWDEAGTGPAVALIEWGERFADGAGEAWIRLGHAGETARSFELDAPVAWGERAGWGALAAWCARRRT